MDSDDYQFIRQRMTTDINAFTARESPREKAKILLQSVPQLDISSTQVRDNLHDEEKVIQWMPEQVYQKLRGFL